MKTLKKTLCLVLAVVMAVGVLILPANAAFTDEADITKDYKIAVTALVNYGILQGKKNGDELKIDPLGDVTRAEVATMTYRLLTGDTTGDYVSNYVNYAGVFSDVTADWQRGPVGFCANGKLVVGIGDGKYAPNAPVTGYELLAIMLRALGYGQLGEFTGAKWKENTYAQAVKSGLDAGVEKTDLSKNISREKVAQIIYNTIKTPRVVYTPGYGYTYVHEDALDTENDLNVELIVDGKDVAPEFDKFGAPTKESIDHKFTYTWPVINIPDTYGKPMTVKKYYEAVTECDVATDFGLTSTTTATKYEFETYNNGIGNVGKAYIEPTDEVHVIGAQGRETAVYVYKVNDTTYRKIVYKDTVLMKVISSTEKLVDTAGHVVKPATAFVCVYKTNRMDGLNGVNLGTPGYTTFTTTIETTEKYAKGTILSANVLTDTPYNTLSEKSTFVNVKRADSVQVTIDGVDVSSTPYGVGFVGTDGNTYRYSLTYAYNAVNGDGKTLNTTDLGKTYTVYLASTKATEKGNYNVIGIAPTEGYATAGVVTKVENVKVASDTKGNPLYAQQITVLTENGEQTILHVTNDKTGGEANATSIDPYVKKNDLIVFGVNSSNTKYYNVNGASPIASTNSVEAGVADTLNPGKYPLVNDETVFFIETYTLSNSKRAYVTAGYDVIKGFKNIPDLEDGVRIYDADTDSYVDHNDIQYAYFLGKDGFADYVVIRFGTESNTVNTKTEKQYAYVQYLRYEGTVSESKVTFNAVIEGQVSRLEIASADAQTIVNGRNGLYIYGQYTNGTNGKVVGPVNHIDKSWAWKHVDGVIDLGTGNTIKPDGEGTGKRFYTVADDAVIYIVNPMTGEVNLTAYDLDTIELKEMYQGAEIYFQLDEYGYIDLVYVVCNMKEDSSHAKPDKGSYVANTVTVNFPKDVMDTLTFHTRYDKFYKDTIGTAVTPDVSITTGAASVTISGTDKLLMNKLDTKNGHYIITIKETGKTYGIDVNALGTTEIPVADIVADYLAQLAAKTPATAPKTPVDVEVTVSAAVSAIKINIYEQTKDKDGKDITLTTKPEVEYVARGDIATDGTVKVDYDKSVQLDTVRTNVNYAGTEWVGEGYAKFDNENKQIVLKPKYATYWNNVTDVEVIVKAPKSSVEFTISFADAKFKDDSSLPELYILKTITVSRDDFGKYTIDGDTKATISLDKDMDPTSIAAVKYADTFEAVAEVYDWGTAGNTYTVVGGKVIVDLTHVNSFVGGDVSKLSTMKRNLIVYVNINTVKTVTTVGASTSVAKGETLVVNGNIDENTKITVPDGGKLVINGAVKDGAEVTVESGATLEAESIEKGADVTVSTGANVKITEWNTSAKVSEDLNGVNETAKLEQGVYHMKSNQLQGSGQGAHSYVVTVDPVTAPKDAKSLVLVVTLDGEKNLFVIMGDAKTVSEETDRIMFRFSLDRSEGGISSAWNNKSVHFEVYWSTEETTRAGDHNTNNTKPTMLEGSGVVFSGSFVAEAAIKS